MPRREDRDAFNRPFGALAKLKQAAPARSVAPAKRANPAPASRVASEEDLFLSEMAGTTRMDAKPNRIGTPAAPRKPVVRPSDDAEVLASLADLCGGDGPFDISNTDEFIEGTADGIDRRLLHRLRAGEYAVQAHLDLHGLSRDEAKDKVSRFILENRKKGHRCVLLVHGRGLHSKDQIPVLKQAVRTWLEKGPIARSVLAFVTARPSDGGAGAVYVLLRR